MGRQGKPHRSSGDARRNENRDCPEYDDFCLEDAAKLNLPCVPCHKCPDGKKKFKDG